MTIARQLRARPVQVLSVLFILNGLAVGAMMAQTAEIGTDIGIVVPLLGASALLATLAALIALARLVRDPLERLETTVRSLSAEVARGGDPVPGLGLTLASSGDLTASTRSLIRLRQVLSDRNRRAEQEHQHRRNVDELLAAEIFKQSAEEQVRHHAIAELADALRRLANGELGMQLELAMPPELEPVRIHFNRASMMLAENIGGDGSHAAILRDTGIALAASTDLASQGAGQASGIIELRRSTAMLGRGAGARAQEAQELAAFAAWARTEIQQCAETLTGAKGVIETVARSSAEMSAAAQNVQDILRETSLASLNLGIGAVQGGGSGEDLAVVLAEVRALAERTARAASSLSAITTPNGTKTGAAVSAVDKALSDLGTIGQEMEILEDRAAALARAGHEDAATIGEVELVVQELEDGARGHANTVERTVLAMSALSRSLGRLELKLGLFRQPAPSLPVSGSVPTVAGTSRHASSRPYLRRVK